MENKIAEFDNYDIFQADMNNLYEISEFTVRQNYDHHQKFYDKRKMENDVIENERRIALSYCTRYAARQIDEDGGGGFGGGHSWPERMDSFGGRSYDYDTPNTPDKYIYHEYNTGSVRFGIDVR